MLSSSNSAYLILEYTDMRKSIDTLAVMVSGLVPGHEVSDGSMFVFCNKRRNIIKVLYWDRNGFCLLQKRLDRGRFFWPIEPDDVLKFGNRELRWLLDGLDPFDTHVNGDKTFEDF